MMTKAEILQQIRDLMNEQSGDVGGKLDDTANLIVFIDDAMEQASMDVAVLQNFPTYLCGTENITLVANQANYTLTARWLMIYKMERNVTGQSPREIKIIDPLSIQHHTTTGDTEPSPTACYILGDTIYFVKTPSEAKTSYARAFYVKKEAATIATTGPAFLPDYSHRLIVYWACALVAVSAGIKPKPFYDLYAIKLRAVEKLWAARYQQQVRHVRPSVAERTAYDDRDPTTYDRYWP